MSDKKNELIDSPKVEPKATEKSNVSPGEVKKSYTQELIQKRKAAVTAALKAYDLAVEKRARELGKLCLECGLGDYDIPFLKDQFTKLLASFPKRSSEVQ